MNGARSHHRGVAAGSKLREGSRPLAGISTRIRSVRIAHSNAMPSMRAVKPNPAPCKSSSTSKSRSQLERNWLATIAEAQPSDELPVGVNNRVEDDGWSDCDHGGTDSGRDGGVECVRLARGGWSAQEEEAIEKRVLRPCCRPTAHARGKVITRRAFFYSRACSRRRRPRRSRGP